MAGISYRRHRFPPDIIQHAVWLYLRFTLSAIDWLTPPRVRARGGMTKSPGPRPAHDRQGAAVTR
jgi:hypothetical protein